MLAGLSMPAVAPTSLQRAPGALTSTQHRDWLTRHLMMLHEFIAGTTPVFVWET